MGELQSRFNTDNLLENVQRNEGVDDYMERPAETEGSESYISNFKKPIDNIEARRKISSELQKLVKMPMLFSKSALKSQMQKREAYYGSAYYGLAPARSNENTQKASSHRQLQQPLPNVYSN